LKLREHWLFKQRNQWFNGGMTTTFGLLFAYVLNPRIGLLYLLPVGITFLIIGIFKEVNKKGKPRD
jgi:cellulose synthase/poly-beta-1,6-N-acetylglucosamine synthase-like glycosyltransferase